MLCRCHNMSFQYELKLHFRRPINQRGKLFRKFSSATLIHQPIPKVTEFMDIQPPNFEEVNNFRMKFFWKKPAFKFPQFEECFGGLALTGEKGADLDTPLDFYTSRRDEHVLIIEKCKVKKITLTYFFNGDYPDLKIHSVPNFCSLSKGDAKIVSDSTKVFAKTSRMRTICDYKSLIVTSFVFSLVLPTIIVGRLMVKWRRRQLILTRNLLRRSQFQNHERRMGEIQHITFDEARGIKSTRDQTEQVGEEEEQRSEEATDRYQSLEEKEKSSSTFGSKIGDEEQMEESRRKLFLEVEMRSENKRVDNGLRYSIGDKGSSSSTGSCSSSSPSSSISPSSPSSSPSFPLSSGCMAPPPPPASPPPSIFY